ncbi:BEM46 family protein [Protomyces lactucae-debilis]|uniref:BEM46 family protein n=1 Tax=Protomyces lactucae-debilis TaxID=2754530 RepID=A0A1Y2FEZ5_PROLT|nr:BEM46 family protein [Protomyces lactucae-debilis]ORY82482.1 BEM46 family protein [Protomyces lactucae-debilis]
MMPWHLKTKALLAKSRQPSLLVTVNFVARSIQSILMPFSIISVMLRTLQYGFYLASASVLAVGACLYAFQLNIIYPSNLPSGSRTEVALPSHFDMDNFEEVWLDTADGEKLHCYAMVHRAQNSTRPTVIMYHANAGNMGHRLPIASVLHNKMSLNVFMLSYRGYGKSTGQAAEKGLKIDADTAMAYILSHPQMSKTPIFVYGQSIGGAVSIYVTAKNQSKVAGLILENTFLSIASLIPSVMPIARPIARFCHQKWASDELIDTIETPILFLSGLQDEVVPAGQMKALHDAATRSRLRVWKDFQEGTHNDTVMQSGYFEAVFEFINKVAR